MGVDQGKSVKADTVQFVRTVTSPVAVAESPYSTLAKTTMLTIWIENVNKVAQSSKEDKKLSASFIIKTGPMVGTLETGASKTD